MIATGTSPKAVLQYQEGESEGSFLTGKSARCALRAPLVSTLRPSGSARQHAAPFGLRSSAHSGLRPSFVSTPASQACQLFVCWWPG
jgi:hypothetical protein